MSTPSDPQQKFFEQFADGSYYEATEKEPRVIKVREMLAKIPSGQRLLDVGCADGSIIAPQAGRLQAYGVDFSQSFVDLACAKGIRAVAGDLTATLPFESDFFDVVFSGETMEHLIDTDRYLSEINRVLKPGGTLLLTVPNVRSIASIAMMLVGYPPRFSARYRSPHYRDFTLRTATLALQANGFKLEQARGTSFWLPKLGEQLSGIADYFPGWTGQMVLRASKQRHVPYDPDKTMDVALY